MSFEASEVEPLVFAEAHNCSCAADPSGAQCDAMSSPNAEAFLHELPTIFVEFRALIFDF
jgi:hypothetical protein